MVSEITILPNVVEKGSQIGRCPTSFMLKKNLKVGSYAEVVSKSCSIICMLLPRLDRSDIYFEIDDSVIVDSENSLPSLTLKTSLICINSLIPIKLPSLQLIVVLSDFKDNFTKLKASRTFQTFILGILSLYGVVKNSLIKLINSQFNKLFSVEFIKILNNGIDDGNIGLVTASTEIEIVNIISKERFVQLRQRQSKSLGGLSNIMNMLTKHLTLPFVLSQTFSAAGLCRPKGILLIGPPGTGKTSLVKEVCKQCGAYLISVVGADIFRSYPGESEVLLRQIFSDAVRASREGPTVLFIDEIDTVCPKRNDASGNHQRRLVTLLLILMDGIEDRGHLVIIGATNLPTALEPSLRRAGRFDKEIYMNVPTKQQRSEIVASLVATLPLSSDIDIDPLASVTIGYVGADLELLCQEAKSVSSGIITMKDFEAAMQTIRPTPQRGSLAVMTELAPVKWTSIGGLADVIESLQQFVELPLLYPDRFAKLQLKVSQGILLYGPSGCCKTTLVRALATSIKVPVFSFSSAQIFSPFVGESEKTIAEIFHKARLTSPCILFFDEFESLVGKREHDDRHNVQQKVLAVFLNEMDGIGLKLEDIPGTSHDKVLEEEDKINSHQKTIPCSNAGVFVIAATNKPELIDSALLRPGRFDKIIYVPPPDKEARFQILKTCSEGFHVEHDLKLVAAKTDFFSGADLKKLFCQAAVDALVCQVKEDCVISSEHFETALDRVKPSLTFEQLKCYQLWRKNA